MPPIEYDCEGCGVHVHAYGRKTPPVSHLCSVCEWFCEHETDPERMISYMQRIDHLPRVCTHYACRCARAAELAAMADRVADTDLPRASRLLAEAVNVHSKPVQCRGGGRRCLIHST